MAKASAVPSPFSMSNCPCLDVYRKFGLKPCLCGAANYNCVKQQVSSLCSLFDCVNGYRIIRLTHLISHILDIDDAI